MQNITYFSKISTYPHKTHQTKIKMLLACLLILPANTRPLSKNSNGSKVAKFFAFKRGVFAY